MTLGFQLIQPGAALILSTGAIWRSSFSERNDTRLLRPEIRLKATVNEPSLGGLLTPQIVAPGALLLDAERLIRSGLRGRRSLFLSRQAGCLRVGGSRGLRRSLCFGCLGWSGVCQYRRSDGNECRSGYDGNNSAHHASFQVVNIFLRAVECIRFRTQRPRPPW